jgi:hypothetical protein
MSLRKYIEDSIPETGGEGYTEEKLDNLFLSFARILDKRDEKIEDLQRKIEFLEKRDKYYDEIIHYKPLLDNSEMKAEHVAHVIQEAISNINVISNTLDNLELDDLV